MRAKCSQRNDARWPVICKHLSCPTIVFNLGAVPNNGRIIRWTFPVCIQMLANWLTERRWLLWISRRECSVYVALVHPLCAEYSLTNCSSSACRVIVVCFYVGNNYYYEYTTLVLPECGTFFRGYRKWFHQDTSSVAKISLSKESRPFKQLPTQPDEPKTLAIPKVNNEHTKFQCAS